MCLSVSVSINVSVIFVSTDRTLAKIKNVKNDIYRFLHLSNCVIVKIVLHDLDVLFEDQRFESRRFHGGECPFKCNDCEYYCTRSSSLPSFKLTHSSKRPFKCDECEFKCEGDICTKTNSQLTRHKRADHL